MTLSDYIGIIGIIVGLIGIVVGLIGWKSLKVATKIKNVAKNTGTGSMQQAGRDIYNEGVDAHTALKFARDEVEKAERDIEKILKEL